MRRRTRSNIQKQQSEIQNRVCRGDLIEEVAFKTGKSQKDVHEIISMFVNRTVDHLKDGDEVYIYGLGVFDPYTRSPRNYYHPSLKKMMTSEEKKDIRFRNSETIFK